MSNRQRTKQEKAKRKREKELAKQNERLGKAQERVNRYNKQMDAVQATINKDMTSTRKVSGLEGKLNDLGSKLSLYSPSIAGEIASADWWNIKVRQPFANWTAKKILTTPLVSDGSSYKLSKGEKVSGGFFQVLVKLLILFIILMTFSLYTLPLGVVTAVYVQLGKDHIGFIGQLVTLFFIILLFDEFWRYYRSVAKYMDFYSNNMVDQRLADTKDYQTAIGEWEGYKIGWAKGTLYAKLNKGWQRQLMYALQGLVLHFVLIGANYIDVLLNDSTTSPNVETLQLISQSMPFLLIVTSTFLAPVVEEFVFRGVILRSGMLFNEKIFEDNPNQSQGFQTPNVPKRIKHKQIFLLGMAIVFQGILFAVAHSPRSLGYGLGMSAFGIAQGLIYYYSGNIKACVMTHGWSNAYNFIFALIGQLVALGA